MKKIYVLDTNVILTDPTSFENFEDNEVVIPLVAIEELERHKTRSDETGRNAREFTRKISKYIEEGQDIRTGIQTPRGGIVRAVSSNDFDFHYRKPMEIADEKSGDNLILSVAKGLTATAETPVFLVTQDLLLQIKANAIGVKTQNYKNNRVGVSTKNELYIGHRLIQDGITKEDVDYVHDCAKNGEPIDFSIGENEALPNEFITLKDPASGSSALMRWVDREKSFKLVKDTVVSKISAKNKEQKFAFDLLMDPKVKLVTLVGKAGSGKANPVDTPTLTPSGWVKMGNIKPGDYVISVDGTPTKVLGVFPQGEKEVFEVRFSDGTAVKCCKEHLWETKTVQERDQKKPGNVRSTEELMRTLHYGKNKKNNHSIPMTKSVQFTEKETEIDPYVLGAMLGDGSFRGSSFSFTNLDHDVIAFVKQGLRENEHVLHEKQSLSRAREFYIVREQKNKPSAFRQSIENLGLAGKKSNEKFVPDEFKYNSISVRLALFQGLMDTDGTVSKNGMTVSFSSSSECLAKDVQELVWSFGGKATISTRTTKYFNGDETKEGKPSHRVTISLPPEVVPFRSIRKLTRYRPRTKYQPTRYIVNIEPKGIEECVCISVEHPRHLYLTKDYIATHNTLCAIAAGLQQTLDDKLYKSMVICRPVQPLGKDIGFLPGPQPLDAKVLTPTGWTTMGELKVGFEVISRDGKPTRVTGVFPKGVREVFKVSTKDGQTTEACGNHLWLTQTHEDRKRKRSGSIKTTLEIKESLRVEKKHLGRSVNNQFLPRVEPVHFEKRNLVIPPYVLGALLGDGCFSNGISFTSHPDDAPEIVGRISQELSRIGCLVTRNSQFGYHIKNSSFDTKKTGREVKVENLETNDIVCYSRIGKALEDFPGLHRTTLHYRCQNESVVGNLRFSFGERKNRWSNKLKNELANLGLWGRRAPTKFIPDDYLYSSIEDRLSLLQGLMDTDGTVKENGEASFSTCSLQLCEGVAHLVRSLGGRTFQKERSGHNGKPSSINGRKIQTNHPSYEVSVSLPPEMNPFHLERKAIRHRCSYLHGNAIVSIEAIGTKEVQCIQVENPEHLYVTDDFIVTHNTLEEKMEPWVAPIKDNLRFLLGSNGRKSKQNEIALNMLFEKGIIEVEAMTYIRGRSIADAYMVIDEAQNLTAHELKTIITRVGEGTKIVLTGDVEQIDVVHLDSLNNGLTIAVEKFKDSPIAGHVTLFRGERSELASLAADVL